MINNCKKEILELHQFFEDWFNARIPDKNECINRLMVALAPEFKMITPSAKITEKKKLISTIRSAHGLFLQDNKPSDIEIKDITGRIISEDTCLMTYEEWQVSKNKKSSRGRLSSALFKKEASAPNQVQWIHLHEVWIP